MADEIATRALMMDSPREAFAFLAKHVEQLTLRIERLEEEARKAKSGWDSWSDEPHTAELAADIATIDARRAKAEQPSESEFERPYEPELPQLPEPTGRIKHKTNGMTTEVEIAEPTPEQARLRKLMTKQRLDLNQQAKDAHWDLPPEIDPEVSFWRYGPYWLYTIDREYVVSLPFETRQLFVTDIELDDPQIAKEVARDILKADAESSNTSGSIELGDE